jgi:hypothetical protein
VRGVSTGPYYAGAARLEEAQAPRLFRSEDPLQVADLAAATCLQTGSLVQGVVCAGHVPWRQSLKVVLDQEEPKAGRAAH